MASRSLIKAVVINPGIRGGKGWWSAEGVWQYGDRPSGATEGGPKVRTGHLLSQMKGKRRSTIARFQANTDDWAQRGYVVMMGNIKARPKDWHLKEVRLSVDEVANAIGPKFLAEAMRRGEMKFQHTNGAHPKSSVGGRPTGMFTPLYNLIQVGVKTSNDSAVRATSHEIGHFLDKEAVSAVGNYYGKGYFSSYGGQYKPHYFAKEEFETATKLPLIQEAIDSMSLPGTDDTVLNRDMTASQIGRWERMRLVLGSPTYWSKPTEIFARLFEQYISTRYGREGVGFEGPGHYQTSAGYWSAASFRPLIPKLEDFIEELAGALGGDEAVAEFREHRIKESITAEKLTADPTSRLRKIPRNARVEYKGHIVEIRFEPGTKGYAKSRNRILVDGKDIYTPQVKKKNARFLLTAFFKAPPFPFNDSEKALSQILSLQPGEKRYFRVWDRSAAGQNDTLIRITNRQAATYSNSNWPSAPETPIAHYDLSSFGTSFSTELPGDMLQKIADRFSAPRSDIKGSKKLKRQYGLIKAWIEALRGTLEKSRTKGAKDKQPRKHRLFENKLRNWLSRNLSRIVAENQFDSDWPKDYCADTCCAIFNPLKHAFPSLKFSLKHSKWHTWIETSDGLIVDPTAHQFKGFKTPVVMSKYHYAYDKFKFRVHGERGILIQR